MSDKNQQSKTASRAEAEKEFISYAEDEAFHYALDGLGEWAGCETDGLTAAPELARLMQEAIEAAKVALPKFKAIEAKLEELRQ